MNVPELRAELARHNLTIPRFAELVGISKKAMYDKFSERVEFRRNEIAKAKEILNLSDDKFMFIFFKK